MSIPAAAELAAPHNAVNGIGCANYCHLLPTVKSPYWNHVAQHIDDTPTNKLCNSCHTASSGPFSMVNAPAVKTHSSLSTDTDYGNWTIGCTDCHSPHFQEQLQWNTSGDKNMFLATGRITNFLYDGVGESLLTLDPGTLQYKAGWDAARLVKKTAEYRRAVLLPDRLFRETDQSGSLSFQVVAVDDIAETITVKGDVTPVYDKSSLPSEFGIIYGQLIRQSVKRNGFTEPVKFFDNTADGSGGFTDQTGTAYPRGICQVCHTQTSHWSPTALAAGDIHYPDQACSECHDHASGFKPGCNGCHGNPPIVDIAQAQNGLVVTPAPTGSASAGAHATHVANFTYPCATCHYNGMPTTPVEGNKLLQMGFSGKAIPNQASAAGTTYNGRVSLANGYDYQATNGTIIIGDNSQTCTVYCHSDGRSISTSNPPAGSSPPWNGSQNDPQADNNTCNNCHGYPPRYDSHNYHTVRGFDCAICHYSTTRDNTTIFGSARHINGAYDVVASPTFYARKADQVNGFVYTPAPAGSGFGGTCSSNLCHQYYTFKDPNTWSRNAVLVNAQPVPSQTLSQGAGFSLLLIDRSTDADYNSVAQGHSASTPGKIQINWGDGAVEMFDLPMTDVAKKQYFSHTYGTAGIKTVSVKIKDNDQDSTFVASPPKTYEIIDITTRSCTSCHPLPPATGSHVLHGTAGQHDYACTTCHQGGMPVRNANGSINEAESVPDNRVGIGFQFLAWDGTNTAYNGNSSTTTYQALNNTTVNATAGGPQTCANTYCHSDGRVIGAGGAINANISPRWDGTGVTDPQEDNNTCNNCHGDGPRYDAHYRHVSGRGYTCDFCHYQVTTNGNTIASKSKHANGVYNVTANPNARFTKGSTQYAFSFNYTFQSGGGTCSSNSCHASWLITYRPKWTYAPVLANDQPTLSYTISQTAALTLTVTDQSTDPDYNTFAKNHFSGPGKIEINWGDGSVERLALPMTNTATPRNFSHTYATAGTKILTIRINDNDPDSIWVSSGPVTFGVTE